MLCKVLAGMTIGLLLTQACSSNDPPALWRGASPSATATSDASTDSGSTDGLPPATELCVGLTRSENPIGEIGQPWAPPEMLGGVLELGTYELTQLLHFRVAAVPVEGPNSGHDAGALGADASASSHAAAITNPQPSDGGVSWSLAVEPTGRSAQSTIVIEEYVLRRLALWKGESERAEAFRYGTQGATLSLSSVCPTRGSEATYGYSLVGDTLSLLVDPQHLEIYSKR